MHELALSGPELEEESFLKEGTGSHFESRVSELVVLRPSSAGLDHLPAKVDQLVARGFHNLIVSLGDCGDADPSGPLGDSRGVLDTWAGTLRVVDAPAGFAADGLEVFASVSAAVEAYKATLDQPLDPGESGDLLQSTSSVEDPNDWGWGTDAARDDQQASGPSVPIAELLVEDSELPKLDKDLRKVLLGGKKHVSLRLYFSRPMREDDVTILTRCRDLLANEGGQLALVALPQDALKWLKLLDLHREFLLCESPDEAEEAHQRHAR
ncbi:MAG TPA: hypothetical protein DEA08_23180, partial [Planctomycetes bacterium]|nr:hypothetical protein [Planctomycetota bacterium]